jgi:hypothetical protein
MNESHKRKDNRTMYTNEHRFDAEGHCRFCDVHLSATAQAVCPERNKQRDNESKREAIAVGFRALLRGYVLAGRIA